MLEFFKELEGGSGPVFLKLDHLAEETIASIEDILHSNERPSRGRFHARRGTDYRRHMVEMHISEIGFCSGHSASGIWVDNEAETTVPGLYAAGDVACVPHNYMLGAFVYGAIAGKNAADYCKTISLGEPSKDDVTTEMARINGPKERSDGIPPAQMEYKIRRLVNDYLQPPKVTRKMEIGLQRFAECREDLEALEAVDSHELLRAMEVHDILDCAEMAATASLFRKESRWGLYHYRVDYPERNDREWFVHVQLVKDDTGGKRCATRPIAPYLVEIDDQELKAYDHLRVTI